MHIVTALVPNQVVNIGGETIDLAAGEACYVRDSDVEYYQRHPDAFTVHAVQPAGMNAAGDAIVNNITGASIHITNFPAAYTFATLPAAATALVGEPHFVTDLGPNGSYWYSNGTRWLPVGGQYVAAQASGLTTAPLAALTGVTAGTFGVPTVTIPANVLSPGVSKISVSAAVLRSGLTAPGAFRVNFGKTAAEWAYNLSMAATDNLALRVAVDFHPNNGSLFTTSWLAPGATNTAAITDRTNADLDTTADQILQFAMTGMNAADTFKLISYQVVVFA